MNTDINANLLIHYTLQQLFDRKVNNLIPNDLGAGEVEGLDPKVTMHDLLGWTLAFEAEKSYVKLPTLDFTGASAMTLAFWYQASALNSIDGSVFCLASKNVNEDYTEWLSLKNTLDGDILLTIQDVDIEPIKQEFSAEKLRHFALVIADNKVEVFLDGASVLTKKLDSPLPLGVYNNAMLGNIHSAMPSIFAQFRLYSRALSAEEVRLLYFSDLKEGSELNLMFSQATDEPELTSSMLLEEAPKAPAVLLKAEPASPVDATAPGQKPLKLLVDPSKAMSLSFDGASSKHIELPFNAVPEDGLGLEAWINIAPDIQSSVLLGLSSALGDFYIYIEAGFIKAEMGANKVQLAKIQADRWFHLALLVNPLGLVQIYLDGLALKTQLNFALGAGVKVDAGLALGKVFGLNAPGEEAKLLLGADKNDEKIFSGRIDQLKLYNSLLQAEQIKQSILDAQGQNPLLKNKAPIELDIFTTHQDNTFHILDAESKNTLHLEVNNTTNEDISCATLTELNAAQYHLLLRFRQSTLSADTLKHLAAANAPKFTVTDDTGQKIATCAYRIGYDATEYVDWIAIQFPKDFVLPKNTALQLAIPDVTADKAGGARNTRVELNYANLVPESHDAPIERTVLILLEIQSHLGINPLVAQISPNNIFLLGEQAAQSFSLVIRPRSSTEKIKCSNNPARPTRFLVALPDHPSFGESGFEINCLTPGFRTEPPAAGQKIWAFVCEDNVVLSVDTHLNIQVSNWKPSQVTSNETLTIFLEHRNIEGYKDDVIRLPIYFSNMVQREDKIGIGTDKPQAKLHVKGNTKVEGSFEVDGKTTFKNELSLHDSMTIAKDLTVQGDFSLDGKVSMNKPLTLLVPYDGNAIVFKPYYNTTDIGNAIIRHGDSIGLIIGLDEYRYRDYNNDEVLQRNNYLQFKGLTTTHYGCLEVRLQEHNRKSGGEGGTNIPLRVLAAGRLLKVHAAYYARHTNQKDASYGHWNENQDIYDISIYADGRVFGSEFNAHSDARIKDVQGRLSPQEALETIQQLQVTQYTYKDTIAKGDRPKLGFIAQELETIMPNTVSHARDYVPNIMAMSQSLHFEDGTLTVTLAQPHGINDDAQLKLIFEKNELKAKVKVISPLSFSLPYQGEWPVQQLFVYGEEVSDFRTVDHDQLNALSIAAIQQLIHDNTLLKQQLEAVHERLARLESLIK